MGLLKFLFLDRETSKEKLISVGEGDGQKRSVQQGRSLFDARSVPPVREHGKTGENAALPVPS